MSTHTDGNAHEATASLHAALNGDHTSALGALLEEAIGLPGPHHPVTCPELPDMRTHIVLTTNDGATFLPERDFITEHSGVIRELLADGDSNGVAKDPVPLQNVGACELKRILWFLQQDFDTTQLERCIASFEIESVVALQQAANFMDVRCITTACAGVIAQLVRAAADDEERAQLLELVTVPRLPQELCELWLGRLGDEADELLQLLAKHTDQLLSLLTNWDSAWADKGRFSKHLFKLSNETEFTLLKARSVFVKGNSVASPMKLTLHTRTTDDELRNIKELTQLTELKLRACDQVTNMGIAYVKELTQLTSLDLSWCDRITDAGLVHIKELKELTQLSMRSCNKITDAGLAQVKEFKEMTSLNLQGCNKITNAGLAHLKDLPQLTLLNLSGCNQITDAGLVHVKELAKLTELNLSSCEKITGAGLTHLKQLAQLKSLNLTYCNQMTDLTLTHIKEMTQLTSLYLSGCDKITDDGLAHVRELAQLTLLDLSGCDKITDDGLAHVKVLKQLTLLDLSDCDKITDTGLVHVKKLKQLKKLNLSYCNDIMDDCLIHLKELTELTSLDIEGCSLITDTGLLHLKELQQLTSLNLRRCDNITLHGELFASILSADVCAAALADVDVTLKLPDGTTLLHVAAQKNRKNVVAALIKRGADANAVDGRGRTPLQIAIEVNAMDAIRLLQQKGM